MREKGWMGKKQGKKCRAEDQGMRSAWIDWTGQGRLSGQAVGKDSEGAAAKKPTYT